MSVILVIEDEHALREEIVTRLGFEDFQVYDAPNGESGIQLALECNPDLILCDVNMPGMSGYEVLSELRSLPQTVATPFIFLTARVTPTDVRTGMSLGADDYITKPFNYQELMHAIRIRIEKHRNAEIQTMESLTRHLVKKQDEERRQIAQVMSDGLYRPLTSLRLLISTAKRLPQESARAALDEMNDTVSSLLDRIESVQTDLWPTSIEYLGIVPVLLWHFSQLNANHGLHVDFQYERLPDQIPDIIKNNLYYVITEALTNVVRHAQTGDVSVRLWTIDGKLWCEITDGGVGFDFTEAVYQQKAFGLLLMRERVRACSGDLNILSSPDTGTTVAFAIPLHTVVDSPAPMSPRTLLESSEILQEHPVASGQLRVLVAEEHELIRRGLRQVIDRIANVRVSAECEHSTQILPLLNRQKVDVLILDLELPGVNTLELLSSLRERGHTMPIIAMAPNSGSMFAWEALQKGASACVLKASAGDEMADAMQAAIKGDRYISPVLSAQALASYLESRNPQNAPQDELDTLTARERQILEMVANDYQNARIAEKLFISIRTVETHRANLMRKLGLHTKSELVRYAIRRGITSVGE